MSPARLLVAAFLLLAGIHPALAQDPPACSGRNLIDQLAADHPDAYAQLITEAGEIPNGEALFWKITPAGGSAPSWLLGTGHLTDPRITSLKPETLAALDGAATVALELKEAGNLDAVQAQVATLKDFILLPKGETLQSRFTPAQWSVLAAAIPAASGFSLRDAQRFRPWLLASAFVAAPCEVARRRAGLPVLDEIIARRAAAAGKEVVGLETVEGQVSAFAGADPAQENAYLLEAVRNYPKAADQQETMAALYAARRTALLLPFARMGDDAAESDQARLAARFMEQSLIGPRNRIMRAHMEPLLAAGNAFIAVGALHLPGKDGLVSLLRQDGYKVDPVN